MRLAFTALVVLLAASDCGHATTVRAGRGQPVGVGFDAAVTTTSQPSQPERVVSTTQRATRDYRRPPTTRPVIPDLSEWNLPPLLRRIGGCESSGRSTGPLVWAAANRHSTASGAWQWLDSTWNRFRGYLRAMFAPPEVQVERAKADFGSGNTRPWSSSRRCWA